MVQLKKQEAFPNLAPVSLFSLLSWPSLEAFSAPRTPTKCSGRHVSVYLIPLIWKAFLDSLYPEPLPLFTWPTLPPTVRTAEASPFLGALPGSPVSLATRYPLAWRRPVSCRMHWLLTWLPWDCAPPGWEQALHLLVSNMINAQYGFVK